MAKIIPIPRSPRERLIAAGLLRPGAQPPPHIMQAILISAVADADGTRYSLLAYPAVPAGYFHARLSALNSARHEKDRNFRH